MKKTLIIISLFIAFLIIYFLQANFFQWFTIAGIMPNLFVIFILFISLFTGMKIGISCGFLCGLFLDIVLGKNLGTYTIMFTIISALGVYFDKNFSKDSRITIMIMVASATLLFELGSYLLNVFILNVDIEILPFIKILLIEIIYNAIITIILYPIFQAIGYKIEDTFKGQKILTKYF